MHAGILRASGKPGRNATVAQGDRMTKRIITITAIAALALFACLALSGCGLENMDEKSRKDLGFALGIGILAASGIGYFISGQYFARKRKRSQIARKQRAKSKKRR